MLLIPTRVGLTADFGPDTASGGVECFMVKRYLSFITELVKNVKVCLYYYFHSVLSNVILITSVLIFLVFKKVFRKLYCKEN